MAMNSVEKMCGRLISKTFKVINPIKKKIINTDCEVHLFIQDSALDILNDNGHYEEVEFYNSFKPYINKGLIWADQDFKSYFHFYNPRYKKGMYGNFGNAMTLVKSYYNNALYFINKDDYINGMAYFGALCHIIQDLTIPQHAKGKLLDSHKQFETYVKLNYRKIKRFKITGEPLVYKDVSEYVENNSKSALSFDYMYKNINESKSKFYLIACSSIGLAQKSTAGCMLMFFEDLKKLKRNEFKSI